MANGKSCVNSVTIGPHVVVQREWFFYCTKCLGARSACLAIYGKTFVLEPPQNVYGKSIQIFSCAM